MALECVGEQHRTDDRQCAREIDRIEALAKLGWIIVRFTKVHMSETEKFALTRVAAALKRARV